MTLHTPGCPGTEYVLFTVGDYNRKITGKRFTYVRCGLCGLIRISEIPQQLGDYYKDNYHILPSPSKLPELSAKDRYRIDTVQRHGSGMRLLEIGPGYGLFAYQACQAGFLVDVIEVDPRCCAFLERQINVRVVCSGKPEEAIASMEKHDVIALWHVIEHLPDPWAVLAAATSNLENGGTLIIATPNPEAWQFRVMGSLWPHLDAPRHLYLLPMKLLKEKIESLGMACVYLNSSDKEARRWNRFGWQRILMNAFRNRLLQYAGFAAGYALSALLQPIEVKRSLGSSYTLVCRKHG